MSAADRDKWERRYADIAATPSSPSELLTSLDDRLPRHGRALDIAGGGGRHAIWLAQRGLDTTLADISPNGLQIAKKRAAEAGVQLQTLAVDLEHQPLPAGPWDVIVSFHYLQRALFGQFPALLSTDGRLVFVQPTQSNLERHAKPPKAFLLEDGELPKLAAGLEVVEYREGWLEEGRHDAFLLARRQATESQAG